VTFGAIWRRFVIAKWRAEHRSEDAAYSLRLVSLALWTPQASNVRRITISAPAPKSNAQNNVPITSMPRTCSALSLAGRTLYFSVMMYS
jgi:hypothetical protein